MFVWNKTINKYYSYGKEITQEEYNNITVMLENPPIAPNGYEYFLNSNLEWELYELPVIEEEPTEEEYAEAGKILLGVSE